MPGLLGQREAAPSSRGQPGRGRPGPRPDRDRVGPGPRGWCPPGTAGLRRWGAGGCHRSWLLCRGAGSTALASAGARAVSSLTLPRSPQERLSDAPHEQLPQSGLPCAQERVLGSPLLGCPARAGVQGAWHGPGVHGRAEGSDRPPGERNESSLVPGGLPPAPGLAAAPLPSTPEQRAERQWRCPPAPPAQSAARRAGPHPGSRLTQHSTDGVILIPERAPRGSYCHFPDGETERPRWPGWGRPSSDGQSQDRGRTVWACGRVRLPHVDVAPPLPPQHEGVRFRRAGDAQVHGAFPWRQPGSGLGPGWAPGHALRPCPLLAGGPAGSRPGGEGPAPSASHTCARPCCRIQRARWEQVSLETRPGHLPGVPGSGGPPARPQVEPLSLEGPGTGRAGARGIQCLRVWSACSRCGVRNALLPPREPPPPLTRALKQVGSGDPPRQGAPRCRTVPAWGHTHLSARPPQSPGADRRTGLVSGSSPTRPPRPSPTASDFVTVFAVSLLQAPGSRIHAACVWPFGCASSAQRLGFLPVFSRRGGSVVFRAE